MALPGSNIFQNPVPRRYFDYLTNISVPFKPKGIDIEGRTEPVTDISEIAPTGSTQSVLTEGIANAALRNQFDFTKPFSTVVRGSGQPYIRDPNKTYDYSGYKLGNPEEGLMGMGKEIWETAKTVVGGHAPNIIANTLGDYTVRYTPKLDPNHPEVMNLYDRYDFVGKMGEGRGSAYDIDVNLPPELLAKIKKYNISRPRTRFKQQQLMNRRKQDMQDTIRQAEAAEAAKQKAAADAAAAKQVRQNIQTYGNRDRPNEGINAPGGGKGQSPTGGDVAGTPFVRGGYVDKALRGRIRYL